MRSNSSVEHFESIGHTEFFPDTRYCLSIWWYSGRNHRPSWRILRNTILPALLQIVLVGHSDRWNCNFISTWLLGILDPGIYLLLPLWKSLLREWKIAYSAHSTDLVTDVLSISVKLILFKASLQSTHIHCIVSPAAPASKFVVGDLNSLQSASRVLRLWAWLWKVQAMAHQECASVVPWSSER